MLKKERPETKIVVCEPDNSAIMGSGIPQARNDDGSIAESHPSFRAHLMQGWTPDFIPKLAEDAQGADLLDIFMPIKGNDALRSRQRAGAEGGDLRRHLGRSHPGGRDRGLQDGAQRQHRAGMLPDTGERYMTTPLFYDISEDMTADEIEISKSTPSFRFDAPPPAPEETDAEPKR